MNQEKIGKFILNLRKKRNLTQAEFALVLGVTSQAVSKWENGRGIPDIELLKKISEEFNVDINEILEGKKTKRNKTIIPIIIIIVVAILIGIFIIYKVNDNSFDFKPLHSDNREFNVKGIAAYSNEKKSIFISNIEYLGNKDNLSKYKKIECTLHETVNDVTKEISTCTNESEGNDGKLKELDELLTHIEFNVDNFNSMCRGFLNSDLYVIVNATDQYDKVITYKIPINLDENCK